MGFASKRSIWKLCHRSVRKLKLIFSTSDSFPLIVSHIHLSFSHIVMSLESSLNSLLHATNKLKYFLKIDMYKVPFVVSCHIKAGMTIVQILRNSSNFCLFEAVLGLKSFLFKALPTISCQFWSNNSHAWYFYKIFCVIFDIFCTKYIFHIFVDDIPGKFSIFSNLDHISLWESVALDHLVPMRLGFNSRYRLYINRSKKETPHSFKGQHEFLDKFLSYNLTLSL